MKYDDIILQCLGDCDTCSVYLECQYQTSSGEEKDKYLKLLTERDEKAEREKQLEPESLAEASTDSAEAAAIKDAPVDEVCENTAAEDVSSTEEVETEKRDCDVDVCTEKTLEEVITSTVTAASDEEVKAIYEEVFNLSGETGLTVSTEATKTAPESATITEETRCNEDAEKQIEVTASVVADNNVTTISDEEVKAIYEEVFNLETAIHDEKIDEKPSCVVPANEDTVKAIYAEVFGLDLTVPVVEEGAKEEKVAEAQVKPVETEEAKQLDAACTEEVKENAGKIEEVKETTGVSEVEKAATAPAKETFKLTPPENNEELMAAMCAKRGRKLIYKPSEAIITATFKVIGTDKKNDIGEKVKDILDAEIKQGVKVGYLDKFDGLNSAEIKEEYENDIVYEFADQEFKKTGVIYDGKKIKVYVYDWDGKACHHIGYVDVNDAAELIPYFVDKDKYSFDVCGIITGGKGKRVVKEGNTLKIVKEKGDPIGVDVDIAVLNRKD